MSTDAPTKEAVGDEQPKAADVVPADTVAQKAASDTKSEKATPSRSPRERKRRRVARRSDRARSEFDQKIVSIRRVTRVMGGGRRFSFSVSMIVGDRRGSVGVGVGKAADTALAIEKAARNAKKQMVKIPLTKEKRIPHDARAKYCASDIWIAPAPGRGLVAGSAVRVVLDLGGVKDVTGKILSRSKNHLNNARATVKALRQLKQ